MGNLMKLNKASSHENGIIFQSITIPTISVESYVDENGEIRERIILSKSASNWKTVIKEKQLLKFTLIFDTILLILSIISGKVSFIISTIYFSFVCSLELFGFINIAFQHRKKNSRNLSVSKFHAAEHMVINAYEKLQRIPTLEEIKHYSRFSKKCGSRAAINSITFKLLYSIWLAFGLNFGTICFLLVAATLMLFSIPCMKYGWLNFLQISVTEKPSDLELEVAIRGMQKLEELEENLNDPEFRNNFDCLLMSMIFIPLFII